MNPRRRAFDILQALDQGRRSEPLRTGDRDDAFVRTLVQGVSRWRLTLDHFIGALSGRSIAKIDPPVLSILRLGIYQLHWMRVPDHAAVNESVELARRIAPRGRSFVNAILRKATRTDLASLLPGGADPSSTAIRTSHPEWLLERWQATFGNDRMERIATANQEPSYPDLLLDTNSISAAEVRERLEAEGVRSEISVLVPDMLKVYGSTSTLSDLIEKGLLWPMDEGSAIVAIIAGEKGHVLDLAAAPGGKTIAMARRGNRVISHDASFDRLLPLIRRRSHDDRIRIVVGDGTTPPFSRRVPTVLLDAPCSATGIIRKHPEIKWRITKGGIDRAAEFQQTLLQRAIELSGETLVYATCSLEREENDAVVQSVLSANDEFELGDVRDRLPSHLHRFVSRGILRLTPDAGPDGFTAFLLIRHDSNHKKR